MKKLALITNLSGLFGIALLVFWAYWLPFQFGNTLMGHLAHFETSEAQAQLCTGSSLQDVLGAWNAGAAQLDGLITQALGSPIQLPRVEFIQVQGSSYNPFTGEFQAQLALTGTLDIFGVSMNAGAVSTPLVFSMQREGLLNLCATVR